MKFSPALIKKVLQLLGITIGHELLDRIISNSISPVDAVGQATGTDTYVVTFNPPITNLAKYDRFYVDFLITNTGVSTLNPDGLGAIDIKKEGIYGLAATDIQVGQIYLLLYDGTNFQISL